MNNGCKGRQFQLLRQSHVSGILYTTFMVVLLSLCSYIPHLWYHFTIIMVFSVSYYKRNFAAKKTKRYLSMNIVGVTRSLHRHLNIRGGRKTSQGSLQASGFRADRKFSTLNDAQLEVKDLHLSIGEKEILKGVDIHIPQKKVTCIIGPSGCGKSTLLRTFNRLNDGTEGLKISGSITLGGKDIIQAHGKSLTELRRNIGLVPQRPCPLPMDIFGNVAFGCRIHGIHNHKNLSSIVEYYLNAVGLWDEVKDRLHDPATSLSGGQQQRLCLARSLAVEPSVILADEATSALDPVSSQKIEDLFTSMKGSYTVVMVTHTLRQAMRIADYVVFMYEGKVVEAGKAYDIFHNPKEKLTSDYLFGTFN